MTIGTTASDECKFHHHIIPIQECLPDSKPTHGYHIMLNKCSLCTYRHPERIRVLRWTRERERCFSAILTHFWHIITCFSGLLHQKLGVCCQEEPGSTFIEAGAFILHYAVCISREVQLKHKVPNVQPHVGIDNIKYYMKTMQYEGHTIWW